MNSRLRTWSTTLESMLTLDGAGGGGGGGAPTIHVCAEAEWSPGATSETSGPSLQGLVELWFTDSTKPAMPATLVCDTMVQFDGSASPGVSSQVASSGSGFVLMPTLPPRPAIGER